MHVQIAAGTLDGDIHLLHHDLTVVTKLQRQPYAVTSLNRQENFLLGCIGKGARIFDFSRPEAAAVRCYEGHTLPVTSAEFGGEEGRWIFTASEDKTLKIWDFRGQGYQTSQTVAAPVLAATLHGGDTEILFGDVDGKVGVWDLTANRMKPLFQARQAVTALAVETQGDSLMVGLADGGLFVTGENVNADGQTLSITSDESLKPFYVGSLCNDLTELNVRHTNVVTRCRLYRKNATVTMLSSSLAGTVIANERKISSASGAFDTLLLPSGDILTSCSDGRLFTESVSVLLTSAGTSLALLV
jgi:WD40 repeat protein